MSKIFLFLFLEFVTVLNSLLLSGSWGGYDKTHIPQMSERS